MFGLVVVLFLVNLGFVRAECGPDTYLRTESLEAGNCASLTQVLLKDDTGRGCCWSGHTSVTINLDGLVSSVSTEQVLSGNTITWPITTCTPNTYNIIATLTDGVNTCEEELALSFAAVTPPSLSLSIIPPASVIKDAPTDFIIEVTNDGTVDVSSVEVQWAVSPTNSVSPPSSGTINLGTITTASPLKEETLTLTGVTTGSSTLTVSITNPSELSSTTDSTTFTITDGFSTSCEPISMLKDTSLNYDLNSKCILTGATSATWSYTENINFIISNTNDVLTLTPKTADWTGTTSLTVTATSGPDTATYDIPITVSAPTVTIDVDIDGYSPPEDCDDGNEFIKPDANETCDGIDQDCDNIYDEDFDYDTDDYTTCGTLVSSGNFVTIDCNDTNELIYPDNSNPYCDCDYTNITKTSKESLTNGECEDGIDNDCDGDIDEDDDDCHPCNIFGDFNPTPKITITSPSNKDFSTIDDINFIADVDKPDFIDQTKTLWEFGDRDMAYTLSTSHTFSEPGTYEVKVSVRDIEDCHTSRDSITININDCFTDTDCGTGICCDNQCKTLRCVNDEDCNQNDTLITDEKCVDTGCNAYCSWGNCTISCNADIDCNDNNDATIDKCNSPGICISKCINIEKELEISIITPINDKTYASNIIPFEYTSSIEASCEYMLNNRNKQRLYSNNFDIEARTGRNVIKLFCNGKTIVSSFTVRGEQGLMSDLTSDKENDKDFLDFFNLKKKKPLIKVTEEEITTLLGSIIKDEGVGYELDKELSLADNKSTIKLGLKNTKSFLALKNVDLTVTFPKEIIENAHSIESSKEFTIIEADPIIKHSFLNIDSGRSETITYSLDKKLTKELLNQIVTDIQLKEVTDEEIEDIKKKIEDTQEATEITKKITKEEGKTIVTTTIVPKGVLKDTKIFLEIPKCMAQKVNDIAFKDKNFKVISDDPLIVWQFSELSSKIDLTYEVGKDINIEDCEKESVVLALAEQIENMERGSASSSYWKIILASLMVPIVGFGVVYFQKFGGKNEMEEFIEKTAETIKQDIAKGYYKDQASINNLKLQLYKNGWDVKSIEELFKKLGE